MRPDAVYTRDDLGKALTGLRVEAGLSVRDVADEADALQGTVAGWFAGQHSPTKASREMFERVLGACGVVGEADLESWWSAVQRTSRRAGRRRTKSASPYRGFEVFGTDDSDRYFGRDDDLERLADTVRRQGDRRAAELVAAAAAPVRGLSVVGASGVGKSSLVRAGLLAGLDEGPLAGWAAAVLTPGDEPLAALAAALAELDATAGPGSSGHRAVSGDEAPSADAAATPAVLVIDQFEELWTAVSDSDRSGFVAELRDRLIGRPVVPVGVLRADFYRNLAADPALAAIFGDAQVVVAPMTAERLREVIVRPAAVVGATVDDDLMDLLLDDVSPLAGAGAADAGVLPLLSYALQATWEESNGRHLTVADYLATGRISGAVEQTAETAYAGLAADEQEAARQTLQAMVNVEEDTVTRRTVRLSTLGVQDEDGSVTDTPAARALETFAAARLITLTSSRAQITHEALLTAWPRLTGWVDADRERLLLQRRLRVQRGLWESHGSPDDLLPGRGRLALFEPLAESDAPLDPADREFLAAGRERVAAEDALEQQRNRKLRRVALYAGIFGIVAVIAAAAAVITGFNAVHQRDRAEAAQRATLSRQLAIQADQLASSDPVLAMEIALAGYREAPTVEARSKLIDISNRAIPRRFTGLGGSTLVARQDDLLAAASNSGQVRLFEIGDDGVQRVLSDFTVDGENLGGVALSPDTHELLLGGTGVLTAWDVSDPTSPQRTGEFPAVAGDVNAITISPDGRFVVATIPDVGVQAWVAAGGGWREVALPEKVAGVAGAAAFSHDGRVLATSSVNQVIHLWRVDGDAIVETGQIQLAWRDNELAQGLAFTPDGRLAAALRSRSVDVFDISDPASPVLAARFGGYTSYVTAVAVSEDGTLVAGAGADNMVRVFDLTAPEAAPRELRSPANPASVLFVGERIITGNDDGRVQDWPAEAGSAVVGTGNIFQIPADAGTRSLITADTSRDGTLTQWEVGEVDVLRAGADLPPAAGVVYSGALTVSGSGDTAALGTVTGDLHFVDLRDPQQPRLAGTVAAQSTLNETVAYSEDTGIAITGATDSHVLTVVDASDPADPQVVSDLNLGGGIWWASLNPAGDLAVVATSVGQVRLVDLSDPADPTVVSDPFSFGGSALAVRFSADGNRIVASADDKTVTVADVSDPAAPEIVAQLSGPAGQLYSVAFSPAGDRVVAGGANSEVWVWDLAEGEDAEGDGSGAVSVETAAVLRSYPGRVYDVRFVDEDRILVAGEGGRIESWELAPIDLIRDYCDRSGDGISEEEWATYVPAEKYDAPCA